MSIDREQVEHVALLARLNLSEDELARLTGDLQAILGFFDRLQELDTEALAPMEHVTAAANVFRDDELRPSLPRDQALAASADHDDEFFRVPQVVE